MDWREGGSIAIQKSISRVCSALRNTFALATVTLSVILALSLDRATHASARQFSAVDGVEPTVICPACPRVRSVASFRTSFSIPCNGPIRISSAAPTAVSAIPFGARRTSLRPQIFQGAARSDIADYLDWYNAHRPHSCVERLTPDEKYRAELPTTRLTA